MEQQHLLLSRFSRVRLFATPWTAAYQASLSMGFSRQECWSGVPLPSPSSSLDVANVNLPWLVMIRKVEAKLFALALQFLILTLHVLSVYFSLENGTATHSSVPALRILQTEVTGVYSPWGCRVR